MPMQSCCDICFLSRRQIRVLVEVFSGTDEVNHPVQAHRFAWPWHVDLAHYYTILRHCHYLLLLILTTLSRLSAAIVLISSFAASESSYGSGVSIGMQFVIVVVSSSPLPLKKECADFNSLKRLQEMSGCHIDESRSLYALPLLWSAWLARLGAFALDGVEHL
eukprot:scaffold4224_cov216-Skeletonema_marinoi.AAC.4